LRCPACGKTIENSSAECPRCECVLDRLQAVHRNSDRHLRAAAMEAWNRNWPAVLNEAERSWRLHKNKAAAYLGFVAAAIMGDSQQAVTWNRRARQVNDKADLCL
jgi:hypothetical protein